MSNTACYFTTKFKKHDVNKSMFYKVIQTLLFWPFESHSTKLKPSQAMILLLLISCMTVSSLGFGQGPNYIPPVNSNPNRKCNIEGQACGAPPAFRALGRKGGASLPCCPGKITQLPSAVKSSISNANN